MSLGTADGVTANVLDTETFNGLGQTLDLDVTGRVSVIIDVSGTYDGRFRVKGSVDGGANYDIALNPYDNAAFSTISFWSGGATGDYQLNVAGLTNIRFETFTLWTSGSAVVKVSVATEGPNILTVSSLPGDLEGQQVAEDLYSVLDHGAVALGVQRTTPTLTDNTGDGRYTPPTMDEYGRTWVIMDERQDTDFSGSITANGENVTAFPLSGINVVLFTLSNTWSGTVNAEGVSEPAGTFETLRAYDLVNKRWVTNITANGLYAVPASCLLEVRLRSVAWTSGTLDVFALASLSEFEFPTYADGSDSVSGKSTDITGTSDTQVIAAQGSGARIYLTQFVVQNSHATVSTWVNIKDGSTTIQTVYAPAGGGGASVTLPKPIPLSDNTALNAACETTGANVRVSASGFKGL